MRKGLGGLALLLSVGAAAQNATTAGAVTTPFPTLENVSIEWAITGDANLNGAVSVRYRKMGEANFRNGPNLRRIPAGSNANFSWSNKHSGSLFGLEPGATYEIELTLVDPDGGGTTRTTSVSTRRPPGAGPGATVKAVTPANFSAMAGAANPGDILELADGTYAGFTVTRDGTAAAPIVIRALHRGQVTVTGDVRLDGRSYINVEGLTVMGQIKFNGATSLGIIGNTVRAVADGIVSKTASTNLYICDNVVTGVTSWDNASVGASGTNVGEGIEVTGPGHVVCHNRVSGFRDCLSTLEDASAVNQVSIDFIENDLSLCADDAVEADFAMGNVRVLRNRISDSFMGLSSQPGLGGPTWFIRNAMYNLIYSPLKPNRGSVGDVYLHNTSVKSGDGIYTPTGITWSRALFRNNLIIGGPPGGTYGGFGNGTGRVASLTDTDATDDFNYDGFGVANGGTFNGVIGSTAFSSLAMLRSSTTETNATQVDLTVFAAAVPFPHPVFPLRGHVDLRLAAGSAAIDMGAPLTGINDGFSGAAPDLGAYELGAPLPAYGPRPAGAGGGAGGSAGAGGAGGSAGAGGAGGSAGAGGAGGSAGAGGAGGSAGAGGAGGSAGAGGAGGSAGAGGAGGSAGAGGAGGSGAGGGSGGAGGAVEAPTGCGCNVSSPMLAVLFLTALRTRPRRRGSRTLG